jgi:Tfp pilus assembly protein PilZ
MSPDDGSGARPAPVVLRIKLRYDDVDTLAARFAPNVGKSGLFLPTKTLQAVGAEVKFELRLADDKVVITGLGKVRAAKAADPDNPRAAFGMAIELTRVTRESRDVILKILAKRREMGLADVAIPMPADIDAAKGETTNTNTTSAIPTAVPTTIDSNPILMSGPTETTPLPTTIDSAPRSRRATGSVSERDSAPILENAPLRDSSPILESPSIRDSAPILDSGPIRDSQPILDSAPIPRREPEQARVLTAPRRASGPIAIAKVHAVAALAPEPARKKRPALQEVIDRASGPVAAVTVNLPGLDDDVDVAAVMAMARSLAGSDLDAELEALRDSSAAPIAISIEAASAELARQLGGVAVTKRGWAPPPPVEDAKPAPIVVEDVKPAPVGGDAAVDAAASIVEAAAPIVDEAAPRVDEAAPRVDEAAPRVDEAAPRVDEAAPIVDEAALRVDHAAPEPVVDVTARPIVVEEATPTPVEVPTPEAPAFVAASTEVETVEPSLETPVTPEFALSDEDDVPGEDHEVDPEQIADEIHQLGEDDFEEVEHTAIGTEPPQPESEPELTPVYTEPGVAAAIEASLDQQLADADSEPDDLGFAPPAAYVEPAYNEHSVAAAPIEPDYNEEELEEIEDFEILAEADEEDADLLASHGEHEASGSGAVYPDHEPPPEPEPERAPEPAPRASYDYSRHSDPDFHARLELSDEHPRAPAIDEDDDEPPLHLDPRELSARNAMAAFEEPQNTYEPMSEFALGGDIPADEFDSPHADFNKPSAYARAAPVVSGFPPLSRFDESDIHAPAPEREPRYLRPQEQTAPPPRKGEDGYDLETALEALDVDLDDLAIPHAKTERVPTIPPSNRARSSSGRMPVQRASTSGRVQTRVPQRPTTDDGVLIDFDDEDDER